MDIKEKLKEGVSIYDLPVRVVYYARVSTLNDEQVSSIVNQVDYFEKFIYSHDGWIFSGGYVDEGISGKSTFGRKNFMRMIEDAKCGNFDLILTKSVSRFARNTIDSIRYTDDLLYHGVGVIFLNDNINTFYSDSEFRLTLMASIAQDELRKLSESVSFGLRQSISRGVVLGNGNILGYSKKNGKLLIVEEEAKIVRDVFNFFISGKYSYSSLARLINDKYCLCYDATRIKRILTNYKYKGYYCGGMSHVIDYKSGIRKKVDVLNWVIYSDNDSVPAIVSVDVWNRANELIKINMNNRLLFRNYCSKIFCFKHAFCMKLRKKRYKNFVYGYFVCPDCVSVSCRIIDTVFRIRSFSCMYVFKNDDGGLQLICQK